MACCHPEQNHILVGRRSKLYCSDCKQKSNDFCLHNKQESLRRGMEQWQLAWLITMRSQVRVLVPLPRKESHRKMRLFSWLRVHDSVLGRDSFSWRIVPEFANPPPFYGKRADYHISWSRYQNKTPSV